MAKETEEAIKAAKDSRLSPRAFGVFWNLKNDQTLAKAGISPIGGCSGSRSIAGPLPERQRQC
jgi:hypothetical protein